MGKVALKSLIVLGLILFGNIGIMQNSITFALKNSEDPDAAGGELKAQANIISPKEPMETTNEEPAKPSFSSKIAPHIGIFSTSSPYKVKVTFNSVTVHNSHEGLLSGDGEYDLNVYVHGKLAKLTDMSRSTGASGLWDVSSGETVNFPPGSEIVVDINKSQPLSIFTVGSEIDGCGRTAFPHDVQTELVKVLVPAPDIPLVGKLEGFRSIVNTGINYVGCKLNPNDNIGYIVKAYAPTSYGAGEHSDVSSASDFTLRYTISVTAPQSGTAHPPVVIANPPSEGTGGQQPPTGGQPTSPQTDTTPPKLVSSLPTNKAINVPLTPTITATFSEPLQISSVNTATLKVKDAANIAVPGSVTISLAAGGISNTAVFKPASSLLPLRLYSVTVTTGIKDLAGNSLEAPVKWLFATGSQAPAGTNSPPPSGSTNPPTNPTGDEIPPKVLRTFPANGATNVQLFSQLFPSTISPITATFSEPIQGSTVNPSTFFLKDSQGNTIPGSARIQPVGPNLNTVVFQPSSPLIISKTYLATITTGVKDMAGNALATQAKWSFSTISLEPGTAPSPSGAGEDQIAPKLVSTFPSPGALILGHLPLITATFSEPIQGSTVNPSTFFLKDSQGNTIPGSARIQPVGPNLNTVVFQPSSPLIISKTYLATITTGVKDMAGNALATQAKWSFTIG